jgi:hypothetical protein
MAASTGSTISGDTPQETCGLIVCGVAANSTRHRSGASASLMSVAPVGHRLLPQLALGRERAPLHVVEGGLVDRHQPGARAGLDRHVAEGHPSLHAHSARIALAAEFDRIAGAAGGADRR